MHVVIFSFFLFFMDALITCLGWEGHLDCLSVAGFCGLQGDPLVPAIDPESTVLVSKLSPLPILHALWVNNVWPVRLATVVA